MSKYVDGFILVVPKKKSNEYKKMAKEASGIWMKHGALLYFECKGEDLKTKSTGGQKPLSFPKMANAKPSEDVWFSFIVFKSKKHRDSVNKKVMKEMDEIYKDQEDLPMPFDMERMAYGGFNVEVEG